MVAERKETPIYFTMKVPGWFINLDGEEKIRVIKKLAKGSPDAHTLSEEEFDELMPDPAE
jgi:hypothetical protein